MTPESCNTFVIFEADARWPNERDAPRCGPRHTDGRSVRITPRVSGAAARTLEFEEDSGEHEPDDSHRRQRCLPMMIGEF